MSLDFWRPPVAIAHRGSRLLWPENTMEAFSGAVSLGYRHLETDLRVTSDGVLVCLHDPTVDRTTDGSG
ncbi:MAG: glycerophosphodiester phosphodiesterase family protein, partial [Acidimicrobiia bacterium]